MNEAASRLFCRRCQIFDTRVIDEKCFFRFGFSSVHRRIGSAIDDVFYRMMFDEVGNLRQRSNIQFVNIGINEMKCIVRAFF